MYFGVRFFNIFKKIFLTSTVIVGVKFYTLGVAAKIYAKFNYLDFNNHTYGYVIVPVYKTKERRMLM